MHVLCRIVLEKCRKIARILHNFSDQTVFQSKIPFESMQRRSDENLLNASEPTTKASISNDKQWVRELLGSMDLSPREISLYGSYFQAHDLTLSDYDGLSHELLREMGIMKVGHR